VGIGEVKVAQVPARRVDVDAAADHGGTPTRNTNDRNIT
jgi:hypothetical protein